MIEMISQLSKITCQAEFIRFDCFCLDIYAEIMYKYYMNEFCLKEHLAARKMMIKDLSSLSGIHASTLSDIINGKVSPRTRTLGRIASALQLSPSELYRQPEAPVSKSGPDMPALPQNGKSPVQNDLYIGNLLFRRLRANPATSRLNLSEQAVLNMDASYLEKLADFLQQIELRFGRS